MRRKLQVAQLQEVADIRKLQRAAAEANVARANSTVAEKSAALNESEAERSAAEKRWHDAISAPFLRLETIPLWTEVVARQDATVQQASNALNSATSAREHYIAEFHAAEIRGDAASETARSALQKHLRKREDDAVQDAADNHLQHGRSP